MDSDEMFGISGGRRLVCESGTRSLKCDPNEGWGLRGRDRLVTGVQGLVAASAVIATCIGFIGATTLRMSNDDYWHAFVARHGFLGAMWEWWSTASGDLVMMASNTLLNGLPLLHFPWPLTSFVPYMSAYLAVGLTSFALIWVTTRRLFTGRFMAPSAALTAAFLWWAFLWTPLVNDASARSQIVLGITHWQNLNTAYIIPPAVLLVGWIAVVKGPWRQELRVCLALSLGVLVGLSGMVLAVSTILWLLLAGCLRWLRRCTPNPELRAVGCSTVFGATVGLLISTLSPGTRARASGIGITIDRSYEGLTHLLVVFPQAAQDLLNAVWHEGSLVVLLVVTPVVALSVAQQGIRLSSRPAFAASAALLSFALIDATVSRTSRVWIDTQWISWWHTTTLQLIVFLVILTGSIGLGLRLSKRLSFVFRGVLAVAAVSASLVALGAVQLSTESMTAREREWSVGPALVKGVANDINDLNGWQYFYWRQIAKLRDVPDRLGFLDDAERR